MRTSVLLTGLCFLVACVYHAQSERDKSLRKEIFEMLKTQKYSSYNIPKAKLKKLSKEEFYDKLRTVIDPVVLPRSTTQKPRPKSSRVKTKEPKRTCGGFVCSHTHLGMTAAKASMQAKIRELLKECYNDKTCILGRRRRSIPMPAEESPLFRALLQKRHWPS